MLRKASLLCIVVALAASLSGCCNKEKCGEKFNLTECTEDECAQKYPSDGPLPQPGPDIILGPGGGNVLEWTIGGVAAAQGASVLDPANTATYCKLRKDFIGTGLVGSKYNYWRVGQSNPDPSEAIHLFSNTTGIELRIKRGSAGGLDWWIKNKTTGESCTLKMGDIPALRNEVPSEFIGLTRGNAGDIFKEIIDKEDAEKINFMVEY